MSLLAPTILAASAHAQPPSQAPTETPTWQSLTAPSQAPTWQRLTEPVIPLIRKGRNQLRKAWQALPTLPEVDCDCSCPKPSQPTPYPVMNYHERYTLPVSGVQFGPTQPALNAFPTPYGNTRSLAYYDTYDLEVPKNNTYGRTNKDVYGRSLRRFNNRFSMNNHRKKSARQNRYMKRRNNNTTKRRFPHPGKKVTKGKKAKRN